MEMSFNVIIIALIALVAALIIIMFLSSGAGSGSEMFRNVTDWMGGMINP